MTRNDDPRAADECGSGGARCKITALWATIGGWMRASVEKGPGADADIAAEVYLRARHRAIPEIPPLVHSDEEVRHWMHRVLDNQEVWLAFADHGVLLGLMVLDGHWVEQLYIDPAWTGRGLGTVSSSWVSSGGLTGSSCGRSCRMCGRSGSMNATGSPLRRGPTGAVMRSTHLICATSGGLPRERLGIGSCDDFRLSALRAEAQHAHRGMCGHVSQWDLSWLKLVRTSTVRGVDSRRGEGRRAGLRFSGLTAFRGLGKADAAGVRVGEDGPDGLFRALLGCVERQADPVGLLPQQSLQTADRPPARPVGDAVPISFPALDGRRVRVQEHQVELGHRNQVQEVPQNRPDDHVLNHNVEPAAEEDTRHRQRPRVPQRQLAQRFLPGVPHGDAPADYHRPDRHPARRRRTRTAPRAAARPSTFPPRTRPRSNSATPPIMSSRCAHVA